jgi:hypothetical protein
MMTREMMTRKMMTQKTMMPRKTMIQRRDKDGWWLRSIGGLEGTGVPYQKSVLERMVRDAKSHSIRIMLNL